MAYICCNCEENPKIGKNDLGMEWGSWSSKCNVAAETHLLLVPDTAKMSCRRHIFVNVQKYVNPQLSGLEYWQIEQENRMKCPSNPQIKRNRCSVRIRIEEQIRIAFCFLQPTRVILSRRQRHFHHSPLFPCNCYWRLLPSSKITINLHNQNPFTGLLSNNVSSLL